MKEFYEDLWERLPPDLELPDLARRREFMLSGLRSGDRALDLGCGEGSFTAMLAASGARAVGMEVAEAALRRARRTHPELDFKLAPIDGRLPAEDGSFELVWASEVIEHVGDTASWMSEVRRVLVPGGRLLITTPEHARLMILMRGIEPYSDPLGDHLHLYTGRSLQRLLREFGFVDVHVRAVGGAPLLRRLLLGRARR
jgi:2-polyprenyl-3-methyl-5-hydroxy-6-metoxy-1,4-benzoquinol methylase